MVPVPWEDFQVYCNFHDENVETEQPEEIDTKKDLAGEKMNLSFQLTEEAQKKKCMFAAYYTAGLTGQLILAVLIVIYILLAVIGVAPPVTLWNFLIFLILYMIIFTLLTMFFYRRHIQGNSGSVKESLTFHCSLMPRYIYFYCDEQPEQSMSANYANFEKVLTMGKNIFFSVEFGDDRKIFCFIIPSEAFQSLQQYKEAKDYIKEKVREQQKPECKTSLLGLFFRSMFRGWFNYVLFCIKMFLVVLALGAVLLFFMWVATMLKR